MPIRHVLGRTEVLFLLEHGEREAAAYLAKQLGLSIKATQSQNKQSGLAAELLIAAAHGRKPRLNKDVGQSHQSHHIKLIDARFWVAKSCEETLSNFASKLLATATDLLEASWRKRPDITPAFYPLVSPKNLLPRLFGLLNREHEGRTPDINKILVHLEEGRTLSKIPLQKRTGLGRHLHIIIDHHPHLVPYWTDFSLYLQLLESQLPDYAFSHELWFGSERFDDWEAPSSNSVVIIFSDLGVLSREPESKLQGWLQIGRLLTQSGNQAVAVLPCHPEECDSRFKSLFTLLSWEPLKCLKKTTLQNREHQADQLVKLLSPAIRLEPGLLRSVRLAIARHGYHYDAGVEALVWQHPEISDPSSVAASFNSLAREQWLEEFAELTDDALKQTVLNKIREWRAGLDETVWFEELMSLDADSRTLVDESDLQDAYQYLLSFRHEVISESEDKGFEARCRWFKRMEKRLPVESWELPEVGVVLQSIAAKLHEKDELHRSRFAIDPANLNSNGFVERTLSIFQLKQALWIGGEEVEDGLLTGCHLIHIRYRRTLLYCELIPIYSRSHTKPVKSSLQFSIVSSKAVKLCDLPDGYELKVRSDVETLHFSQIKKPDWATAITYKRNGLWLEHDSFGKNYLSKWVNPTKNTQCTWEGFPSEVVGTDQYGLYADMTIHSITQRFRWIKSGTFMMGSSETEEGSVNGEDLHEVTLTEGFWLADTTVTQAFWLAVMGEERSPNHFRGEDRPVDQVSWDDCKQFILKFNKFLGEGVLAQLPSEAEWEYACRAGTSTSFYFGSKDDLNLDVVNYSGKWSLHDRNGETKPVKSYPPNTWGLYEMHGNVWEWCEDYNGQYPAGSVLDPIMLEPDEMRILRGGGWMDSGDFCRAASRNSLEQEDYAVSGFRPSLVNNLRPSDRSTDSDIDLIGKKGKGSEGLGALISEDKKDRVLLQLSEALGVSYEEMELLDELDWEITDKGDFDEYWIITFADFDAKERPDLQEIMTEIRASDLREVRVDLPLQYFADPDEYAHVELSELPSSESAQEVHDDGLWWNNSAAGAVKNVLESAEIDEERDEITLDVEKKYPVSASTYEELIEILAEVAEDSGYGVMPRADKEFIAEIDGDYIAYEVLEKFPDIRDFFEHD